MDHRFPPWTPLATACFTVLCLSTPMKAAAQPQEERPDVSLGHDSGSMRSRATNRMTMPPGVGTLGGSVAFITAGQVPTGQLGDEPMGFTDAVLLNLDGRYSFGDVEWFAATSLLPKQPGGSGELVWQSARTGVRWGFADHFASWLGASTGAMLSNAGWWSSADLGLEARGSVHPTIVFSGKLGLTAGGLFPDSRDGGTDPLWHASILTGAEVILRAPDYFAFWVSTDFHFPIWANPDAPPEGGAGPFLDPQTRANFRIGAVLSYVSDWDLYAEYTVLDRGEADEAATTLPVLDGGFDQQQLIIGVVKRFGGESGPVGDS